MKLGNTIGDILVTSLQTLGHDIGVTIVLGINLDLGVFHLVILIEDIDKLLVLHLRHTALGDNDSIAIAVRDDDRT